jgi:glucose uptake protein
MEFVAITATRADKGRFDLLFLGECESVALSGGLAWSMMILSMVCWGSWANTFKLTRGVRFELFYWDYAIGVAASAILLAALLDVPAASGETFPASLLTTGPTALLQAAAAGVLFNLANLLLVAAIAMAGLAVAFPVAIGTALIVGTALTFFVDRKGAPVLIALGVAFAAVAIVCCATAYRAQARELKVTRKGVTVCLVSGLLMATWAPLAASSMRAAHGVAADGAASPGALTPLASLAVFAVAALVSTLPFNLYLMRRPLIDVPVSMRDYSAGGIRWHLLGLLGGAIWTLGTASNLVAGNAVGFAVSYAIGQSAPLVASLWGILVWKEFAGANATATRALTAMFVFYLAAIGVLSRAT